MSIALQALSSRRVFGFYVPIAALFATATVLAACGDDSSSAVTLTLLTPEDGQVLTAADDSDPGEPGVQLDVTGKSSGLRPQTPIELYIDGEATRTTARVDDEGNVSMPDVTLPPGEHTIYLITSVGSVQSDEEQSYTLRTLVIESPEDGDQISQDANEDMDGFQISVRAQAYAIDSGDDIALRVDGEEVATAAPDADGTATFSDVTLADGEHTLQARLGGVSSDDVDIEIQLDVEPPGPVCNDVRLITPTASGDGPIVLGGGACNDDGNVVTVVEVAIDQPDGTSVELEVNGQVGGEADVTDGSVTFEDVVLTETDNNELALSIGDERCEITTRVIQADCAAPTCLIRSPEPVENDGVLYLGQAQLGDDGFDIEVQADGDAEGELVALVLDGDDTEALTVTAGETDGDIVALFAGVDLSDGEHTVSAICRDVLGNIATTPTVEFVVDTAACGVDITAPVAGAVFLPADDIDTNSAESVETGSIAVISGDDCVTQRVGLCNPEGELSGDFNAFDGTSPIASTVTLDDSLQPQMLCVEVQDRAGNVGRDQVDFIFRVTPPMVRIESPATNTSFNAEGDDTHEADADQDTALCDAELVVACEIGSMVELHRNTAAGAVFASGECTADDDAPTGFTGLATITATISEALNDESTTIVATQTFTGSSTSLNGESAAITLATDCQAPVLVESNTPCSLHVSDQITTEEAADFVVQLGDTSSDTVSAALSYWTGADVTDPLGTATGTQVGNVSGAGSTISFATIDFGDDGDLVVHGSLTDNFGNVTSYECESEIVDEIPSIVATGTWPADGATFGPGDATCDPAGAATYGIQIEATIDQLTNRRVSLTVNGEVVDDDVALTSTTISLCVAVPDNTENTPVGPTTIHLEALAVLAGGRDFVEREVNIQTLEITDPVEDQVLVTADDCIAGAGYGYLVSVDVDPMHDGEDYTIVADDDEVVGTVDGDTIEECVPVTIGGNRTFTVSIDGTSIEDSVAVQVLDDTPEIISFDEPADGDSFDVDDQTCSAGPGTFGVRVQAVVDQQDNREADILVNGVVVANNVAITAGGSIDTCVAVPDDLDHAGEPSTITLSLSAVFGAGTDTESVDVSVDTLDIVDPEQDALITAVDDCDPTTGFGYEVVLAVAQKHLGATYSITDGSLASTGMVMSDTVTACVRLGAGDRTITASIGGSLVTESVDVEVQNPAPTISSITAPANNAMFGPGGQTCSAGAGNYGVRVQASVDQSANRVASILVNNVEVIASTPITGSAIDACVAVPDNLDHAGASTITVRLQESPGTRFDTETVTVNVDKLNVTAPTAARHIDPSDDCDAGVGFGYAVSVAVDPALAGASYVVAANGGGGMLTGTVAGATMTGCLAMTSTTTSVTASITSTLISESVAVTVFTGGAPTNALTFTSACPATTSATYRSEPVALTWGNLDLHANYPGQFSTLALRCAHTTVASAATPEAWWTAATPITLPVGTTVASTGASIPFRVGETRYCALRGSNAMLEMSPVGTGTNVTCGFRSTVLHTSAVASALLGVYNAPVGDINGDLIDDMLVGGNGFALLFFGHATGTPFTGQPNVTFTGGNALGFRVAGLGDFNGDGRNDFAMTAGSFNADRGRVFVYFGRATGSAWPSTVDLSTVCNADLCLDHTTDGSFFGGAIAGIGNFAGDAHGSIAVTATSFSSSLGQFYVIQGDDYEVRSCSLADPCRANETCTAGFCALLPASTFWGLSYEVPSGNWLNPPAGDPVAPLLRGFRIDGVAGTSNGIGRSMAPVGSFDSTPGMDFVMSAVGAGAVTSKLYFVSGRADADAGINELTVADLGFRASTGGAPSGTPFETSTAGFGALVASAANVFDVAGGTPNSVDIIVRRSTAQSVYIYPGDTSFAPANRVEVRGVNATDFGVGMARGYHPSIPSLTDQFDSDSRSEFVVSTTGSLSMTGVPGPIHMFYGDVIPSQVVAGVLSYTAGSPLQPPATTDTSYRIVEAAGDLNNDGHPDLFVGDYQANAYSGQLLLLY